jgi:enoyl-CoA hydratase/carnithine racemase
VAASVASLYPPVIAAINGDALGQGLELALGCDIRISAETAHFGLPQVAQGLIPMDGGSQRLPRLIGQARALELLLTAKTIDAREALDLGLVDKVVPQDRLRPEVEALATRLAAKSPIALRYAKEAVIKGMDLTLDQGLRLEADLYFLLHTTRDRSEGVRAFLEKRQARFKGK